MALKSILFILMVSFYSGHAYYFPGSCTSSADCSKGQCCKGLKGQVIGGDTTLPPTKGICAQLDNNNQPLGDRCGCMCDRGFLCYREVTGVCCAPYTCRKADYVRRKQAYWKDCLSNPNCALPPAARPPQDGTGLADLNN